MTDQPPISIDHFINQNSEAYRQGEELAKNVEEEVFFRRLNESTWSPAECFSHIIQYNTLYARNIEKGLEDAAPGSSRSNQLLKLRMPFRWIARFFEPPYKLKVKTLKPLVPKDTADITREDVLEEFRQIQERLNHQLEKAKKEGYELNRIKVPNPIFTFVKMRISECYGVIDAHQRRHLWQAEQYVKKFN